MVLIGWVLAGWGLFALVVGIAVQVVGFALRRKVGWQAMALDRVASVPLVVGTLVLGIGLILWEQGQVIWRPILIAPAVASVVVIMLALKSKDLR
jgi:hypothetical protein